MSRIEPSESLGGVIAWRTERIYDEMSFGDKYAFTYRAESNWLEAAGVHEDRSVIRRKHYVLTDEDEPAFVSAIRPGDILLDPRDYRWKLVVGIEDGIHTTDSYKDGKYVFDEEPYREIYLGELNSPLPTESPFSTHSPKHETLYFNDIERMLVRKKRPRE